MVAYYPCLADSYYHVALSFNMVADLEKDPLAYGYQDCAEHRAVYGIPGSGGNCYWQSWHASDSKYHGNEK